MTRPIAVLLDQNIPREVKGWLGRTRPGWAITHTSEVGLQSQPDAAVFGYAQSQGAILISFDEDFADQRLFPAGSHAGVIRLRVAPTGALETERALQRLFAEVPEDQLPGSLVIIGERRIRVFRPG